MWKTVYQSVQGTSHQRSEQVCQDSCAVREISLADETVLVLAGSDGAGSAEFSDAGSRLAVDTLIDRVVESLQGSERLNPISGEQALAWASQVHYALLAEAQARQIDARQLACTLLFAVLGRAGAAFGQIGDGAMVVWQNDGYQNVFWPQSGEYVNTTNFITGPKFASCFEFTWRDAPVDEVALFTDGLQMLGLNFRERLAHGPFFAPMFERLRQQTEPDELTAPLRAFLESPGLAERTDDDKTLVLATRRTS
jgi:hypothetical protein